MNISNFINKEKARILFWFFIATVVFAVFYVMLVFTGKIIDGKSMENTIVAILVFVVPSISLLGANRHSSALRFSFWYLSSWAVLYALNVLTYFTIDATIAENIFVGVFTGFLWIVSVSLFLILKKENLLPKPEKSREKDRRAIRRVLKYFAYVLFASGLWLFFIVIYAIGVRRVFSETYNNLEIDSVLDIITWAVILLAIGAVIIKRGKYKLHLARFSYIATIFLFIFVLYNHYQTPDPITLYAKSTINVYDCPSESCDVLEVMNKGGYWTLDSKTLELKEDWLLVTTLDNKQGYIQTSAVTEEVPITLHLKQAGNARECPSFDCSVLGQYAGTEYFTVFENDKKGDWYAVEGGDINNKNKIITYYLHKSLFDENASSTGTRTIKAIDDNLQSGPPVKLYAKSYTEIFSCQSETCEVLEELKPGTGWDLDFTPQGEWLNVLSSNNKSGYIKLDDFISEEQFPKRCATPLTYGVGYISAKFINNGFDKTKITTLAQKAEKEWEDALGLNLFNYSPNETHNLIYSRIDSYQIVDNTHWGHAPSYFLPNGAVLSFEIIVFERIIDYYNKLSSDYYVNISKDRFLENEVLSTLIHEFGHAIGFPEHIPGPQNIMFAGYSDTENAPRLSFEEWENRGKTPPQLTQDDISTLQNWCSGD